TLTCSTRGTVLSCARPVSSAGAALVTKAAEQESESSSGGGPQVGTRFSAEEIHDNVSEAAKEELDRPASELIWSALASGLLLGFSFLAVGFTTSLVPPAYHTLAT